MRNAGLEETQAGIKIARRNINNLKYADDTTLMAESEEELKSLLENFEHYITSVWDEYNCVLVWAFFGIAFLWNWNENWPFPVLWPLLSFPNLLIYWVQHFHSIIFQDLK